MSARETAKRLIGPLLVAVGLFVVAGGGAVGALWIMGCEPMAAAPEEPADTVYVAPVPRAAPGPGYVPAESYEALRAERDGWQRLAVCARDWLPTNPDRIGSDLTKMRYACDLKAGPLRAGVP